jgi:hypothetical protein
VSDLRRVGTKLGTVVAAAALLAVFAGQTGSAATVKTHTRMYIGTEFHPLDQSMRLQFIAFTGGGAYVIQDANKIARAPFVEVGVDLPNGANVTEVKFYFKSCNAGSQFYFGAYGPPGASAALYFNEPNASASPSCRKTATITGTGSPLTTATPGSLRYVLGARPAAVAFHYDDTPPWLLVGARIRYTCDC